VLLDSFDLYRSGKRFDKYLKSRRVPKLDQIEREQLQGFIAKRISGNAALFSNFGYFDRSNKDVSKRLSIDRSKRNIFLFSNIYWDVGLSECTGLYQDVIAWVLGTIDLVKHEQGCHLFVKPHPAEVFDSSSSLKGISRIVKEKYPHLPENLTVIEPEWRINTYDLFPFINVGVIFNGTLGLEMMLAGIPVVSTGQTTHEGLGFALEPKTIEAYRRALVGESEPRELDREKLEMFAFFYFIRSLIPWRLTKQVYANAEFDGFMIESLDDLKPGQDPYLDHLCNCIFDPENTVIEAWPGATKPDTASQYPVDA